MFPGTTVCYTPYNDPNQAQSASEHKSGAPAIAEGDKGSDWYSQSIAEGRAGIENAYRQRSLAYRKPFAYAFQTGGKVRRFHHCQQPAEEGQAGKTSSKC